MDFKDCIDFANENPVAWLATSKDDQPHVRAMGMWYADETGFYFQSAIIKDLVGEIKENPKIELAFFLNQMMEMEQCFVLKVKQNL